MDDYRKDKAIDLLNYIACLSEDVTSVTPERLSEINRCAHEVARIIQRRELKV